MTTASDLPARHGATPHRFRALLVALITAALLLFGVVPTAAQAAATGSISGTVTLPSGVSASWLQGVSISARSDGADGTFYGATINRSTGAYTIEGMPAGVYRVQLSVNSYTEAGSGNTVTPDLASQYYRGAAAHSGATTVNVADGAVTRSIDFAVARAAKFTGRVTLPSGAPSAWYAGVRVEVTTATGDYIGATTPNGAGAFTVPNLPAGAFRVKFAIQSYWDSATSTNVTPNLVAEYWNDTTDSAAATLVTATAGSTTPALNATLAAGATIAGRVTLPAGAPAEWLRAVSVSATSTSSSSSSSYGSAQVDPTTGTYRIVGLAGGSYRVQFAVWSYWDSATQTSITPNLVAEYWNDTTDVNAATPVTLSSAQSVTGINAALARGAEISGRITLPAGTPAEWLGGVRVSAQSTSGSSTWITATPDASGAYRLVGLAAGSYRLQFQASSFWDYTGTTPRYITPDLVSEYYDDASYQNATPVVVTAGQTRTGIDAALARSASISGRITLPAGAPTAWLKAVSVYAAATDGSSGYGSATPDPITGEYRVSGLPAGSYRLQFAVNSYVDPSTSTTVRPNLVPEYYDDATWENATPVAVTAGQSRTGINAALAAGATLRGKVTLPAGAPTEWLRGVGVGATPVGGTASTWTSVDPATGEWSIAGIAGGTYTLRFQANPFWPSGASGPTVPNLVPEYYDDKPDEASAVPVTVAAGAVRGNLNATLALGAVLSGTVAGSASEAYVDVLTLDGDYVGGSSLNASAFSVPGLRAGQYYLTLTSYGGEGPQSVQYLRRNSSSYLFTVPAGGLSGQSLTALPATASLAGTITASEFSGYSPTRDFLGDVKVYQRLDTGWVPRVPWSYDIPSARANGATAYTIPGLAAGTYTVGFEASQTPFSANGDIAAQWWQGKSSLSGADAIALTAGQRRTGVDGTVRPVGVPTGTGFVDVSATPGSPVYSAFAADITWMAERGISTGYDVGGGRKEYRPYAPVTRDAMAAFLYRYAAPANYTPPATSPFTDVPTSNSFYTQIAWMAESGISTGYDIGSGRKEFRPYQPITRDAMAAFLYRYANPTGFTAPTSPPFTDVPTSNSFYTQIAWMAATGISTGYDIGSGRKEFRPFLPITRDAMAAFLHRYDGLR